MFRLSLKKLLVFTLIIIFVSLTWSIIKIKNNFYDTSVANHSCNMTDEFLFNLEKLMFRVHIILDKHSLLHILCYGTLWGQIRMSKFLPWSYKGELCIFNDELKLLDEHIFMNNFLKYNIYIKYISSEGKYFIEDLNNKGPYVELYIFEKDRSQKMFKRVGWKRRLLPPMCDWTLSLDCFPTYLIDKPFLPKKQFGNSFFNVPMGGIEIQKYHYADSWWKIIYTKNC